MLLYYDGSFEGLLTAIFRAYEKKNRDITIMSRLEMDGPSMFDNEEVDTEPALAFRVQAGLEKIGRELPHTVYLAWLSRHSGIDDDIYAFVRLCMKHKTDMSSHKATPYVKRVVEAVRKVGWEQMRFLQFVRFVKIDEGLYGADIEPEYPILHLIANHFFQRFSNQKFIIRDLRHKIAMVSDGDSYNLIELPEDNPPLPRDAFDGLWHAYFKTIAIKERINPKLQQAFIPKRYRRHMPEFVEGAEKNCSRGTGLSSNRDPR